MGIAATGMNGSASHVEGAPVSGNALTRAILVAGLSVGALDITAAFAGRISGVRSAP